MHRVGTKRDQDFRSSHRRLGAAQRTRFDSECAEGYGGAICGRCLPGYYKKYSWSGADCTRCEATDEGMSAWYAYHNLNITNFDVGSLTTSWDISLLVSFGSAALVSLSLVRHSMLGRLPPAI